MGSRDDKATPRSGEPSQAGPRPAQAVAHIGAATLAAAGEVGRYHAQRLAEHRRVAWPAAEEPPAHDDDLRG